MNDQAAPTSDASTWRNRAILACCAFALLGGVAVAVTRPKVPERPPRPSPVTVDGESVSLTADAPQWQYVELAVAKADTPLPPVPAPGRVGIDEKRSSSVSSPLAGQIDQVVVRLGDRVNAGDKLFSVRSGALAELEHDVDAAKASVETRTAAVTRLESLVKLQAAPERDLIAARADLKESELQLRTADARRRSLRIAGTSENLFWVIAPQAGTVVDLDVVASQQVGPERDAPLMRISNLDEVIVQADVQERDAAELKPGMTAQVHASTDPEGRPGVIETVSEVVDPQRSTVAVRVRVKNADRSLRPNAFVEVVPDASSGSERVRVPTEAVVTSGERPVIFVAQDAGRLRRVPVQVGRERNGEVEVLQGLQPGARYVSKGALLLLNQIELND